MDRRTMRAEVPGWALIVAAIVVVWGLLSVDDANETPAPEPERVQYLTDADRALLEEVVEAMTTTTVTLPPAQAEAVERARETLEAVTAGDVVVEPAPVMPNMSTTTTPPTTTPYPPTTTTTDRVRHLIPPVTVTVP